jgi:hypothetical protein
MIDNNGWPGKPGVPLNPERDGAHVLCFPNGNHRAWIWRATAAPFWVSHTGHLINPYEVASFRATYLGPCLTPAEVEARIAAAHKEWLAELSHDTDALMEAARDSALEEAARIARHYATIVPMHGSLKSDIYEAAGQAATEIAASIEALAEKELLCEDIIRADRDAWPDHQAKGMKEQGND